MVNSAIHRRVEQQATARGEAVAYVDGIGSLTYRELNYQANAVARALQASGFRRGAVAAVRMDRSRDLAVTLLAVLKAGGAYHWNPNGLPAGPAGVSLAAAQRGDGEQRFLAVDLSGVLAAQAQPSANLPVMTRGTDIACVMENGVLIPHATVTALGQRSVGGLVEWTRTAGALDVWMAWMTGAAVTYTATPAVAAA